MFIHLLLATLMTTTAVQTTQIEAKPLPYAYDALQPW